MKKQPIIVTSVMAAVLLGLSVSAWIREPELFSDSERRELELFPDLSVESVMDGTFMSDFEAYTLDQFPLRESFRRLKARLVFDVFQQKDNNEIYVAEGHASKIEYPLREPMLDHAAGRFEYLYNTYLQDAENLYFAMIPDKNCYLAEENGYLALDYTELYEYMKAQTGYMTHMDLTDALSLEDYYYTDTHWRQENLIPVAQELLREMGADEEAVLAVEEHEFRATDLPFYGVYYGQAALPMEPDQLNYLDSPTLQNCIVTCYDSGSPEVIPMYDMEKAEGKDPYEMFLSGTRAVLTVENPMVKNGKELIVFRDSFGGSLIPLLTSGYETITVLDIRYINSALLGQYVEFADQDVLFLYSTMLLNNSLALK